MSTKYLNSWMLVFCYIAFFVGALYLRWNVTNDTVIFAPIRADAADYVHYAYNMRRHHIYSRELVEGEARDPLPDALRTPGYPIFLALFLSGSKTLEQQLDRLDMAIKVQAILGALTVVIWMYLIVRVFSLGTGLLAGVLLAINPHLINVGIYLLSESLFTFQLSLFFLVLHRYLVNDAYRWMIVATVLLALASLTRPSALYFIVPLLILLFCRKSSGLSVRQLAGCLLVFVMLTGSWTLRNVIVLGKTSDETLQANFLQHGMYPNFTYQGQADTYGYPYRTDPLSSEIQGNTSKVVQAISQRFQAEPWEHLKWYLIDKPRYLFSWALVQGSDEIFIYSPWASPFVDNKVFLVLRAISKGAHPVMTLLALLGCCLAFWRLYRDRQSPDVFFTFVCALFILYFVALHVVGAPFPRYGIPLRPIVFLLAMSVMAQSVSWLKAHRSNNAATQKRLADQ